MAGHRDIFKHFSFCTFPLLRKLALWRKKMTNCVLIRYNYCYKFLALDSTLTFVLVLSCCTTEAKENKSVNFLATW